MCGLQRLRENEGTPNTSHCNLRPKPLQPSGRPRGGGTRGSPGFADEVAEPRERLRNAASQVREVGERSAAAGVSKELLQVQAGKHPAEALGAPSSSARASAEA